MHQKSDTSLDAQLLSDLWFFRWAARLGSITAAADRLHVTQGAVSQRILRLEARLGVSLFARRQGRLLLNDHARHLLEAMNLAVDAIDKSLSQLERPRKNALVVSCMPSLATEWLVPRLSEIYAENPDLDLFIRAELVSPTTDRAEDANIDIFILYQAEAAKGMEELGSLPELMFPVTAPAASPHRHDQDPLPLLHDVVPWIGAPRHYEWDTWRAHATDAQRPPAVDRHFNLAHLAYDAARSGQGVAMGRAVLVNHLLARGDLVPASPLEPVAGAFYRVIVRRPGGPSSPARRLSAWLIDRMKSTQQETLRMLKAMRTTET